MAEMEEASVDAVVCDPPYGIGFMGKEWDGRAIAEAAAKDRASRKSLGPESASRPGRAQPRSSSAFGNEAIIAGPVRGGIDFQHWCESWAREVLRVLKPGGHLLAFGGTRTHHRLAAGIEDAGFEIRDTILWLYGSGFPKSLNVSKAIDSGGGRPEDRRREAMGDEYEPSHRGRVNYDHGGGSVMNGTPAPPPQSDEAKQWQGWGTALKPAHEPIVVARKPLVGTVAATVLEHGTGAINIDACRVGTADDTKRPPSDTTLGLMNDDGWEPKPVETGGHDAGRWPANVILSHLEDCEQVGIVVVKGDQRDTGAGKRPGGFVDTGAEAGDSEPNAEVYGPETVPVWECAPGCPVAALDSQSGVLKSGSGPLRRSADKFGRNTYGDFKGTDEVLPPGDSGGASRFFYCAKTSRAERNAGLEGFDDVESATEDFGGMKGVNLTRKDGGENRVLATKNSHPTVKPINLMRWLVRLVTPPGGRVLDCFLGSGSTGCAAALEGFDFIGIEREPEYVAIAEARIRFWAQHEGREVEDVLGLVAKSSRESKAHADRGQSTIDDLIAEAAA
jgi:site-specific DNA-methyltransferase (adenine-specific)